MNYFALQRPAHFVNTIVDINTMNKTIVVSRSAAMDELKFIISIEPHLNPMGREWMISPLKNHVVIRRRIFIDQVRLTLRKET